MNTPRDFSFRYIKSTQFVITARNEVGARLCFYRRLWFCPQGGSTWPGAPPWDQVHPPGPGTPPRTRYTPSGPGTPPWDQLHPPGTRYTPRDQVHPPGPGAPLGPGAPPGTRYTPLDQVHSPRTRYPPRPGTPPRAQVHPPVPGTPPRTRYTPRRRACWEIRPTRGRYASYWNAILCFAFFFTKRQIPSS